MSRFIVPIVFGVFGLVMAGLAIGALYAGYWIGRGGSRYDRGTNPGKFWLGVLIFAGSAIVFIACGVYNFSRY
jgi:MFS family permease